MEVKIMSRKTLMAILGILGAILAFFQQQFGLSLDSTALMGAAGLILAYVFFEAKLDFKRIQKGVAKFKDPKFWLALLSAILVAINEAFGWNLPIEIILTVISFILSILFGKDFIQAKKAKA